MLPPIEYIPDSEVGATLDEELRALLSTCFTVPHNERFKRQRFFSEMPQHRWLIREPGRVIAHMAVHDKSIGTPAGDFAIGGIAEVSVHPDFRSRGIVKQLVAAAHAALARRGVPFAFLFGNRDVYRSSGYLPVNNPLRFFDPARNEWCVRPDGAAMVAPLGSTPWPEGEIDLRGPTF